MREWKQDMTALVAIYSDVKPRSTLGVLARMLSVRYAGRTPRTRGVTEQRVIYSSSEPRTCQAGVIRFI